MSVPWVSSDHRKSLLRELIGIVAQPDILSFAGGLPATELLPHAELAAAFGHVLKKIPTALQYNPAYPPLQEHIVKIMRQRGVTIDTDEIVVTSGAQQGLQIIAQLLLREHRAVLVEEATYTGLVSAIAPFEHRLETVPSSLGRGVDPTLIAARLEGGLRPAFQYLIPDAHNPYGTSMPGESRRAIARLALERQLLLVEDDPYGLLRYDGETIPPIRSHEANWVFYLGSFSKIIAPSLRLGWMVLPREVARAAETVKDALDLESSALIQRAVTRYLDEHDLQEHIVDLRTTYRHRRDAMLAALTRWFPASARWSRPEAGFFVWVELERGVDTADILRRAIAEEKLAFVPGQVFAAGDADVRHCMRLSFSSCDAACIEEGIERLARLV